MLSDPDLQVERDGPARALVRQPDVGNMHSDQSIGKRFPSRWLQRDRERLTDSRVTPEFSARRASIPFLIQYLTYVENLHPFRLSNFSEPSSTPIFPACSDHFHNNNQANPSVTCT